MKSDKRPQLKIDWATHEAAKFACENWHYSKKVPVNKLAKLGVWEDKRFIGVVIFSCGSAGCSSYSKTLGIKITEIAELARVALNFHKTPVSRIIAVALKILKKKMPGLRILVSYADREQNHTGIIYQATNWTYVGLSSKDFAYIDGKGKRHHSRNVSETGFKIHCGVRSKCPKPSQMTKITVPPKHKYLMPLDKEMKNKIERFRKPYPKRVTSVESGTFADQAERGGESPTVTLQSEVVHG